VADARAANNFLATAGQEIVISGGMGSASDRRASSAI
jgi:hypothetical protein